MVLKKLGHCSHMSGFNGFVKSKNNMNQVNLVLDHRLNTPTTQSPHDKSVQMFAKHLTHRFNLQLQNPQILGVLAFYLVSLRIYICQTAASFPASLGSAQSTDLHHGQTVL